MRQTNDLDQFPRPGLTVDLAILTVTDAGSSGPTLRVLVQHRTDPTGLALPGGFMRERSTVERTIADVLERKVGISVDTDIAPRLLRVFDDPDRDERTWALSLAHSISLPEAALAGAHGELVPVLPDGHLAGSPDLLFDHAQIVTAAITALRERYDIRYRFRHADPDPDQFLPQPFTLHQLRKVHEAVLGARLHKDNFNRRMKEHLAPLTRGGEPVLAENLRGRPAALYRTMPKPRTRTLTTSGTR